MFHKPRVIAYFCLALAAAVGCEKSHNPHKWSREKLYQITHITAFTAPWCAACRSDAERGALLQFKARGVAVEIVNIDTRPDLVRKYGIKKIPLYHVTYRDDGKIVAVHSLASIVEF